MAQKRRIYIRVFSKIDRLCQEIHWLNKSARFVMQQTYQNHAVKNVAVVAAGRRKLLLKKLLLENFHSNVTFELKVQKNISSTIQLLNVRVDKLS